MTNMKNIITIILTLSFITQTAYTQDSLNKSRVESPYSTTLKVDGPVIAAGVGLTVLGTTLIANKDSLTKDELETKMKDNIPFFDRGNAGWYSDKANDDSYLPFYAAFSMPIVMILVNKNERQKAGQILVLYTETMAITGTLYTLSAGLINRSRPLVYGTEAPLGTRLSKNSQRSFFAGHTAASAAATFFAAKIFSDFNPDSKAKPYVWAIAAAIPASVGYLRFKAGQHFLSDNLLGYAIGASAGILIPQLHKNYGTKNVTILPNAGDGYQGLTVLYKF